MTLGIEYPSVTLPGPLGRRDINMGTHKGTETHTQPGSLKKIGYPNPLTLPFS